MFCPRGRRENNSCNKSDVIFSLVLMSVTDRRQAGLRGQTCCEKVSSLKCPNSTNCPEQCRNGHNVWDKITGSNQQTLRGSVGSGGVLQTWGFVSAYRNMCFPSFA